MSGALNHEPGAVIKQLLIDLGLAPSTVGREVEWSCYHGSLPDEPPSAILVKDTDPKIQGRTHNDGEHQLHYGIQIRVRGETGQISGFNKAHRIFRVLESEVRRTAVSLGGSAYLVQSITAITGVIDAGRDEVSRRRNWTMNLIVDLNMLEVGTGS